MFVSLDLVPSFTTFDNFSGFFFFLFATVRLFSFLANHWIMYFHPVNLNAAAEREQDGSRWWRRRDTDWPWNHFRVCVCTHYSLTDESICCCWNQEKIANRLTGLQFLLDCATPKWRSIEMKCTECEARTRAPIDIWAIHFRYFFLSTHFTSFRSSSLFFLLALSLAFIHLRCLAISLCDWLSFGQHLIGSSYVNSKIESHELSASCSSISSFVSPVCRV